MPKNPTIHDRIAWHIEHQKQCACRPIPARLIEEIRARSERAARRPERLAGRRTRERRRHV
jgi:hypothetical protein